ncbi:MFS transporter [Dysgonomonas sp. GY617]|uniref:MFS transporter n=1 Tax=Dysgonomonas sp. GY617 TaxID=2780420 RepID=UPI001884398B|nr:MFS transporter [Dysgonomonas sp. GY617]MBF0574498.1 MFS transporter [Dysgonomonas sp. GY617]
MSNTIQERSLEKIRLGVLTFFLCQGLCFASWASRIPDIKDALQVSDTFIWGLILFMIPVGKFLAIPLAGYTVSKFGSRIMVQISILGYALSLFLIGISSDVYVLGTCLFLFGIFWNLTDISLNTQAIGIEKIFGKTIMGSFHGAWSLAACVGAVVGFAMINFQIPHAYHFTGILALIVLSWLFNKSALQTDVKTAPVAEVKNTEEVVQKKKSRMPELVLIQLGLIGLFALIVESAMFDWGGVYFESIVKAPKSLQIGFLVFMIMMTTGRFLTNKAYQLFGKQRTIQIAGALIFVGMFISALFPSIVLCSLGFMLVGLGISCMVPTIYSVVGEKSKMPTSIALTILSTISFVGSLIAPLLIGSISHTLNMKYAYIVVGILGLIIVALTTFTNAMKEEKKTT